MKLVLTMILILTLSSSFVHAEQRSHWLAKVPAQETQKSNPYHGQSDAVAAGRRLFEDHCAPCHGDHAQGTRHRPRLTSERVQHEATEGDLRWFIRNGSLRRGMPSWSRLPDQQLWQIVTYLKSLSQPSPAREHLP